MNLRKFITSSLMLVIGLILHQITPPILMGMKPDFLLAMMFIAILITDDYKTATVVGAAAGILTAATTTFPGGQIANFIDKMVTSQVIFMLYKLLPHNLKDNYKILIMTFAGTLVSGFTFLGSALLIAGLPTSFKALVLTVVLPATVINTAVSFILFKTVNVAVKQSWMSMQ